MAAPPKEEEEEEERHDCHTNFTDFEVRPRALSCPPCPPQFSLTLSEEFPAPSLLSEDYAVVCAEFRNPRNPQNVFHSMLDPKLAVDLNAAREKKKQKAQRQQHEHPTNDNEESVAPPLPPPRAVAALGTTTKKKEDEEGTPLSATEGLWAQLQQNDDNNSGGGSTDDDVEKRGGDDEGASTDGAGPPLSEERDDNDESGRGDGGVLALLSAKEDEVAQLRRKVHTLAKQLDDARLSKADIIAKLERLREEHEGFKKGVTAAAVAAAVAESDERQRKQHQQEEEEVMEMAERRRREEAEEEHTPLLFDSPDRATKTSKDPRFAVYEKAREQVVRERQLQQQQQLSPPAPLGRSSSDSEMAATPPQQQRSAALSAGRERGNSPTTPVLSSAQKFQGDELAVYWQRRYMVIQDEVEKQQAESMRAVAHLEEEVKRLRKSCLVLEEDNSNKAVQLKIQREALQRQVEAMTPVIGGGEDNGGSGEEGGQLLKLRAENARLQNEVERSRMVQNEMTKSYTEKFARFKQLEEEYGRGKLLIHMHEVDRTRKENDALTAKNKELQSTNDKIMLQLGEKVKSWRKQREEWERALEHKEKAAEALREQLREEKTKNESLSSGSNDFVKQVQSVIAELERPVILMRSAIESDEQHSRMDIELQAAALKEAIEHSAKMEKMFFAKDAAAATADGTTTTTAAKATTTTTAHALLPTNGKVSIVTATTAATPKEDKSSKGGKKK